MCAADLDDGAFDQPVDRRNAEDTDELLAQFAKAALLLVRTRRVFHRLSSKSSIDERCSER